MNESSTINDVTIVGAGFCGTVLAHLLARRYSHVALIDKKADCPPCFKAEKLEPEQVQILRDLGLFDLITSEIQRIHFISIVRNGRLRHTLPIEQYGVPYHDLVNCLRRKLPKNVQFIQGLVSGLDSKGGSVRLHLEDSKILKSKLAVLACGVGVRLQKRLALERRPLRLNHSMCFGFNVVPIQGGDFNFDSYTLHGESTAQRIAYLTLFRMKEGMRVNFFTYWNPKDEKVKTFADNPIQVLNTLFPRLAEHVGRLQTASKVEVFPIDLYQVSVPKLERIVLASDFFQSVCPTTGMGLTKVLTDARLLGEEYIPRWLTSESCSVEEIEEFYRDPRKVQIDLRSFISAVRLKEMGTNSTFPWKARRTLKDIRSWWRGVRSG